MAIELPSCTPQRTYNRAMHTATLELGDELFVMTPGRIVLRSAARSDSEEPASERFVSNFSVVIEQAFRERSDEDAPHRSGGRWAVSVWLEGTAEPERYEVAAEAFDRCRWYSMLPPAARLEGDVKVRRLLVHALRTLAAPGGSLVVPVVRSLGWHTFGERDVYITTGAQLTDGAPVALRLEAAPTLRAYSLRAPEEGDDVVAAVHSSLALLDAEPASVVVPLVCAAYRAPLGGAQGSLVLQAPPGSGKTSAAQRVASHFGAALGAPGAVASFDGDSALALEQRLAEVGEAVLVIDDVRLAGASAATRERFDRLLRGVFNRSSAGKLRGDGSLRLRPASRAYPIFTSETVPRGGSLLERTLVLRFEGRLSGPPQRWIGTAEDAARAAAMASYLRWLASAGRSWRRNARSRQDAVAGSFSGCCARTALLCAELYVGLEAFTRFALERGALDEESVERLLQRGREALASAAAAQAELQHARAPAQHFLVLLREALATGAARLERAPSRAGDEFSSELARGRSRGQLVGCELADLEADAVFLYPGRVLECARALASREGAALALDADELGPALRACGALARTSREACSVQRRIRGVRTRGLLVRRAALGLGEAPAATIAPLRAAG